MPSGLRISLNTTLQEPVGPGSDPLALFRDRGSEPGLTGFEGEREDGRDMKNRDTTQEREQAISLGILPEENVPHWTMIEEGRYQPRRTRGSLRGRELA
jgi:hypothetical protein